MLRWYTSFMRKLVIIFGRGRGSWALYILYTHFPYVSLYTVSVPLLAPMLPSLASLHSLPASLLLLVISVFSTQSITEATSLTGDSWCGTLMCVTASVNGSIVTCMYFGWRIEEQLLTGGVVSRWTQITEPTRMDGNVRHDNLMSRFCISTVRWSYLDPTYQNAFPSLADLALPWVIVPMSSFGRMQTIQLPFRNAVHLGWSNLYWILHLREWQQYRHELISSVNTSS